MELQLVPLADAGENASEAAAWTSRLRLELEELDDVSIDALAEPAPEGSKGLGAIGAALLAHFKGVEALKALVGAVRAWAARTGRTVEVSIDGDVLKISGASREQQELVIEAWLVRHGPAA